MGIKRLTSDLKPYISTITLGHNAPPSPPQLTNAIIDGPSMVYHLFYKLQSHKSRLPDRNAFNVLPTYTELGIAVEVFLDTLERHGVKVCAIIFDGGLPISKRSTRLERLEDVRRQLETFKLLTSRIDQTRHRIHDIAKADIATAIWSSTGPPTGSTLPAPPFIVPTAIDILRSSKYAENVRVVPGEADAYCAAAARLVPSNTAILSSDSDMLMYEDAGDATIVPFSTLMQSTVQDEHRGSLRCISAEGWTPGKIAEQLDVPNLQYFGFQRELDGSASSAEILQRAKTAAKGILGEPEQWISFTKQYSSRRLVEDDLNVDPRLSELICQLERLPELSDDQELHVYLPPLLEDPSRDASWTYGRDIRQAAYSVLALNSRSRGTSSSVCDDMVFDGIYEYARSGTRISRTRIAMLTISELRQRVQDLVDKSKSSPDHAASARNSIWLTPLFHSLTQIASAKYQSGRSLDTHSVELLLGLSTATEKPKKSIQGQGSSASTSDPGWARQHLLANVHAVLYSGRMLGQVRSHVLSHQGGHPFNEQLKVLVEDLAGMTSQLFALENIQEVFLTQSELLVRARDLDRNEVWAALRETFAMADLDVEFPSDPLTGKARTWKAADARDGEAFESVLQNGKRKRKRKRKKGVGTGEKTVHATVNPFAALEGV